jgi:hypothetical protein
VGTDGNSLRRSIATVIPLEIEAPEPVGGVTPMQEITNLGDNWHRHTPTLQAALPHFRQALEGALDICHTILLPADWKVDKTLTGHTHHTGGVWRRGEAAIGIQILARNVAPYHMLSDFDWKRRPKTSLVMIVEALNEESRPGFEGFLDSLAQHCELSGGFGESGSFAPARVTEEHRHHYSINGFRLLEDESFNDNDPWFAACPKVYYGYMDFSEDPMDMAPEKSNPRPWWKRGAESVPASLRKALGSLRGNVQLIRVGGRFMERRVHRPTRLVVSGYQHHSVHDHFSPIEVVPGEVLIVRREPHTQRIATHYSVGPNEDIPSQLLRLLEASCDDYADKFVREAVLDSHLMPLQAGEPAPESKIESPALPAAKPPRKRPRD